MVYDFSRIADIIDNRRKELGIKSMDLLFEGISYTKQSYYKCRSNNVVPPFSVLLELCQKLDCEIGYLLGEYDMPYRDTVDCCKYTGLSQQAIELLHKWNNLENMEPNKLKIPIINEIIEMNQFSYQSCYGILHARENRPEEEIPLDSEGWSQYEYYEDMIKAWGKEILDKENAIHFFARQIGDEITLGLSKHE